MVFHGLEWVKKRKFLGKYKWVCSLYRAKQNSFICKKKLGSKEYYSGESAGFWIGNCEVL